MWEKNFCSLLFFVIYNHTFWLENTDFKIVSPDILETAVDYANKKKLKKGLITSSFNKDNLKSYDSIKTVTDLINFDDFGFEILQTDLEKISFQFSTWQKIYIDFEALVSQNSNNWNKTLITTKSLLGVIYLELCEFEETQEIFIINKFVAKYLKISQDYLDSKNVSLIHAIITKIYPNFNLNIEEKEVKTVSENT